MLSESSDGNVVSVIGAGRSRVPNVIKAVYGLLLLILAQTAWPIVAPDDYAWLYGYWYAIADEDNTNNTDADWNELRADGTYVNISPDCRRVYGKFHIFEGDVYITYEIPKKGPIAMIFRPSKSKVQLTYTSPRTRNNATMSKVEHTSCKGR
jgi:hypothetical protein